MRIAHFIQRYPPALGGSEAFFARLSRYLTQVGDNVTVFTTTALDLAAFWSPWGRCMTSGVSDEDGIEVRRYSLLRWPARRYFLKPLSLVPVRHWQWLTLPCNPISCRMWRDVGHTAETFDVVHATAFPYAFPIACGLRLARRLRVPFALTPFLHLGDPNDPRDFIRRAYTTAPLLSLIRAADRVFVQTAGEQAFLERQGVSGEKLVLLGMGVELAECTGGDGNRARLDWGLHKGDLVIGHLANQSREKGTIDLLQAADLLWQRGYSFRLVIAGPEMPNFQKFWNAYQVRVPVVRRGMLSDSEKRDFFAGINVFGLPSRSDSFGLVLLEAWANGVPSVAYRAGGIADVIRDGQDGLLVPCGDVPALAEALGRIIADSGLRIRLGQAGHKRIDTDFRWSDKLQQIREVYQNVTGSGGESPRLPVHV
jgi:glycosyltransferase involved in cell wall biosynthesis